MVAIFILVAVVVGLGANRAAQCATREWNDAVGRQFVFPEKAVTGKPRGSVAPWGDWSRNLQRQRAEEHRRSASRN
jgi:hypothetical protein